MWFILPVAIAVSLVGEAISCPPLIPPLAYKLILTKINLAYKYVQAGTNLTHFSHVMGQSPESVRYHMMEDVQEALNDTVEVMLLRHVADSNQLAAEKAQFKLQLPRSYSVLKCDYLTFYGAAVGIWKSANIGSYGCVANDQQFIDQMCTVEQAGNDMTKACYYANSTIVSLPETFRNVNFDMEMSNYYFSTASTEQQNNFVKLIKKNLITRRIITDGTGDVTLTV